MNVSIENHDEINEIAVNSPNDFGREQSSNPSRSQATVGYVDPNTDPSLMTTEMRAKLYKQHESPRKTAEMLVKEFAYSNGVGDSTRPFVNQN